MGQSLAIAFERCLAGLEICHCRDTMHSGMELEHAWFLCVHHTSHNAD
jgi:hypothetical protein